MSNYYVLTSDGELYHYGIKGMRWGHRKRQDSVSIASAGRRSTAAYANMRSSKDAYKVASQQARLQKAQARQAYHQAKKAERSTPEARAERAAKAKRAAKIGAAVVGTALATYGAYKLNKYVKTKNCQIAAKRGFDAAEKQFNSLSNYYFKQHVAQKAKTGAISRTATYYSNSGRKALESARSASTDRFGRALRNVVDYKRSGGDLRNLNSVGFYTNATGSSMTLR